MSQLVPETPRGRSHAALSDLLRSLCDGPPGPIRVREIVDHFGHRAHGAVLFVFSVPNLLPLPPGSSTILGLPLVIMAPQLMLGIRSPWLPRFVGERSVDRRNLSHLFTRLIPQLEKVEKLLAPRLGFMFGPVGDRVLGAVCFFLSLVLILPIPLGNLLPAAAVSALALGITQKDGVFALIGYALTIASVAVLLAFWGVVAAALWKFTTFLGL